MDLPDHVLAPLAALSDAMSADGIDLAAILAVLQDDLSEAVPSYLGLRLTVTTDGSPTVLNVPRRPRSNIPTPASSLRLPLATSTGARHLGEIVFYAGATQAFTDLAADAKRLLALDGEVKVDAHLEPDEEQGSTLSMTELHERSTINQAIGVLLDQGHTPGDASDELSRRARREGSSPHLAARHLLDVIDATTPPASP